MTSTLDASTRARPRGNPGPLTLSGTNTWVVGRDPAWVVDPGPAIDAHLDAVAAEVAARGGAGGIALTHDHARPRPRRARAARAARRRRSARPLRGRPAAGDGDTFGPLARARRPRPRRRPPRVRRRPAPLHRRRRARRGQRVRHRAACASTSTGCGACARCRSSVICPGHGDAGQRPAAQARRVPRAPRRARAQAAGRARGGRASEDELLDAAWDDAPAAVRPFAAITLRAHLEKLREEGRWPRPGAASRPAPRRGGQRASCRRPRRCRRSCAACRRPRARARRRGRARSPRARARRRC